MPKSSTKEKITKVALDLFREKGINATSVEDILLASGTGKSQFYYYFKSKDGIISAALDDFCSSLKIRFNNEEISSWKELSAFFNFFIEINKDLEAPRACPLGFIGIELNNSQEKLSEQVNQIFDFIKQRLKNFFERMKKNKELKKDINPETLAEFCLAIIQGGLMTAKIRKDIQPLKSSIKHALKYLESLRVH